MSEITARHVALEDVERAVREVEERILRFVGGEVLLAIAAKPADSLPRLEFRELQTEAVVQWCARGFDVFEAASASKALAAEDDDASSIDFGDASSNSATVLDRFERLKNEFKTD